jgi:hypothetical protein
MPDAVTFGWIALIVLAIIIAFRKDGRKIADLLWNTTVFPFLIGGLALLCILAIAVAINFHILYIPKQYCHNLTNSDYIKDFCK